MKRYPKLLDMVVKVPLSVYTTLADKYGTDGSPPFFSADHAILGCPLCEVCYTFNSVEYINIFLFIIN